jgi:hypothetical protein
MFAPHPFEDRRLSLALGEPRLDPIEPSVDPIQARVHVN